jgi:DNA-binding NarL/FixJ family response regulator
MRCKRLNEILTPREMQYARLVAECYLNAEISDVLGVSKQFVKQALHRIYLKVGCCGEGFLKARIILAIRYDREHGRYDLPTSVPAHDCTAQTAAVI